MVGCQELKPLRESGLAKKACDNITEHKQDQSINGEVGRRKIKNCTSKLSFLAEFSYIYIFTYVRI